jgi:cysteinyl-tRNA synthetase
LWKFTDAKNAKRDANDAKEPSWNTTLGKGRPGWHIEDTAITEKFFGPQYDLHGAGVDLIFPHHEAEIAQMESASGKKPMVKIWMHSAFFDMKGEKMSKSLGNIITARDFLKQHNANVFRFIVASHHYHTRIEYDEALAVQAEQALAGVQEFLAKLELVKKSNMEHGTWDMDAKYEQMFANAMDDDLNTPQALAALFNLIAEANKMIWNLPKFDAKRIAQFLRERFGILGITLPPLKIPTNIKHLAAERELSRRSKQFVRADVLREKIESLGWSVEDTTAGALLLPK